MSTHPNRLAAALGMLAAGFALCVFADDAKPSPAAVAKARGECAQQKHRVKALEAANADDAKVAAARLDWEHACDRAQALIDAAAGHAAAPAPTGDTPAQGQ
ncbi:MAG: hypothetical protein E6R07_00275 [Nevskiaceae bacterium]|nr:MAG: hypothetical protein E6R07_00275 [Nevskiaceae bacterium]